MIKLCTTSKRFLEITDKLKLVKGAKITEKILYNYMMTGLCSERVFTYISLDGNKMNGSLVLLLTKDILDELTLGMVFT